MARLKKKAEVGETEVTKAVSGANAIKRRQASAWKDWTPEQVLGLLKYDKATKEGEAVLSYITESLPALKKTAGSHKDSEGYIVQRLEKEIAEGHVDIPSEDELEYELVPVSQTEVKKALKTLLSTQNDIIAALYKKHAEINEKYFKGVLAVPLITVERLSNRTLGNYTYGDNVLPLENHIRMNKTFVALNKVPRLELTLVHETIHQWQDQVLYAKKDQTEFKEIEMPTKDSQGNLVYITVIQKKRPRNWHNQDFRDMAAVLGIPCEGKHCGTGPAEMPEPKSYNRKFRCMCVSSNGYPLTVWTTRPEFGATCNRCGKPFTEVKKDVRNGGTIEVSRSHIELPNEDGVETIMKEKYTHFERFKTKALKDAFVDSEVKAAKEGEEAQFESGIYQTNHNAYKWGYHYWVAYNGVHLSEDIDQEDVEQAVAKLEGTTDKEEKPATATKATTAKARTGKILKFPASADETPPAPPEIDEKREYSVDAPQDIVDLYKVLGTLKAVAEKLGTSQTTVKNRVKKFEIDFNAGTFKA